LVDRALDVETSSPASIFRWTRDHADLRSATPWSSSRRP